MTMLDSVCECCNRKKSLAGVACIPGMPVSIAWCFDCLQAGVIPYWAAVAQTAINGGLENCHEGWVTLVQYSVGYHDKSMEQFAIDVAAEMQSLKQIEEQPDHV